jgi:phosphoglycolate phosphatase
MKLTDVACGRRPAALLFDLDGTLLDSAPDLAQAVDRMLAELGHGAAGEQRVRQWVGNGSRKLVQRALAFALQAGEDSIGDAAIDSAQPLFLHHYGICCTERSRLYDGVYEALVQWRQLGIAMACVTNKPGRFTEVLLDHFGLREFIGVAVSGDTLAVRKPDAAPLLFACTQLAVDPAQTVMVGDSRNDVLAARAAGMPVICVDYGYNYGRPVALELPDLVIGSFLELI